MRLLRDLKPHPYRDFSPFDDSSRAKVDRHNILESPNGQDGWQSVNSFVADYLLRLLGLCRSDGHVGSYRFVRGLVPTNALVATKLSTSIA
jgi:hypothetical protein